MNTDADPAVASHPSIGRWLVWLLPGVLVVVILTWWAIGMRTNRVSGFGTTRVTFTFTDTKLEDVLAVIRPGVPVEFDGDQAGFMITLKVKDMEEHTVMSWITELIDQEIELREGVISVREVSWLERSYRWTSAWLANTVGIRVWPHR